jgi:iron complex outermembrane receptor protein
MQRVRRRRGSSRTGFPVPSLLGTAGGFRPRAARRLPIVVSILGSLAVGPIAAHAADRESPPDLGQLSIEDLASIEVSSVSKTSEPLSDAPAAIYVITQDDIIRSGATSIPEMLRLAPNLEVAQFNANTYAISARGFNGVLANKLLVLIDGRSVYSPLYAGVYWDAQQVLPEDIERIEVISGPGGTLWGANAVNGVINIITRKSSDTQGGFASVGGGNLDGDGAVQYGGKVGANATYRLYGTGFYDRDHQQSSGLKAMDGWHKYQGGFRLDWSPSADLVTVQGDAYRGREEQLAAEDQFLSGQNLVARWTHRLDGGSELQVQAYYDNTHRFTDNGGGGFALDTFDIDIQHSFSPNAWNSIVWGGGDRVSYYRITNIAAIQFLPSSRTTNLGNIFFEDTISLSRTVKLIPGMKVEWDPYVGSEFLPSLRASWKFTDANLLWAAVSRAVRSPTPYDRDINLFIGPVRFLTGGQDFRSETLTAYEVGYRTQPTPQVTVSVSTFDNVYDNLRSIEVNPAGGILPLQWGNMMEGSVYGVEAWGSYGVNDWWRLSAGFNVQHEKLKFKFGSSQFGGTQQAGDDPNHQVSLRSSMNLSRDVALDLYLREVGELHNPVVSSYTQMNARVAWEVTQSLQLSVSGFNLLRSRHVEFVNPPIAEYVARSFLVNARLNF